ncbi:hypothetical protein HDV63DRAFT_400691 [Trichoderma sp. SZMC 28014]
MNSTFAAVQQWAEGAKEHPASWAQRKDDYLLLRRTKKMLERNHEHAQRESGNQRAAGIHKKFLDTNNHQHRTTNALPNITETADLSQWPPQNMFSVGHLNVNSSDSYRITEATYGDEWVGGREDKLVATRELQSPAVPDSIQEAPNIACESGLYLDYPPDVLPQNIYGPPQPISTFQEYWDLGEDANQPSQLYTEALPQNPNVQYPEVDFNDPFWATVFASSGDSAINSYANTCQGKDSWEQ